MEIKPFKGLLADKNLVTKIISPPYDVITREEASKQIKENPYSFLRITRADAEFNLKVNENSEIVYERTRKNLEEFLRKRYLLMDELPSFYLLSQTLGNRTQTGLYCLLKCEDYKNGLIKKHELTRKDKEEDRTSHILHTKANTGPVFLFFKHKGGYRELITKIMKNHPDYIFTDSKNVKNCLWKISEEKTVTEILNYFKEIDSFYIADGHHRAAAAFNLWQKKSTVSAFSYFMGVIFPSDDLTILPYNRVIKLAPNEKKEIILSKLNKEFQIIEMDKVIQPQKGQIGMYMDKRMYLLIFKEPQRLKDNIDKLDVSVLHNYILSPIFGIRDPRKSESIDFIGGENAIQTQLEIVNSGKMDVAFFLSPITTEELMKISDEGKIMPPKSTWFEPKLNDGLVTYLLEEDFSKL